MNNNWDLKFFFTKSFFFHLNGDKEGIKAYHYKEEEKAVERVLERARTRVSLAALELNKRKVQLEELEENGVEIADFRGYW